MLALYQGCYATPMHREHTINAHHEHAEPQSKFDQFNALFSDVIDLADVKHGDPKRVLKYYKTRGRWFQNNDKYFYDFAWPEPYKSERQRIREQGEEMRRRRERTLSSMRSAMRFRNNDSKIVAPTPSYESDEDEEQYHYDPTVRLR